MASKFKKGIYGMTQPRVSDHILGTAIIISRPPFDNIKGEIISERNDHMRYLTIQIPAEYKDRVYIINVLHSQCKDIEWRRPVYDNLEIN